MPVTLVSSLTTRFHLRGRGVRVSSAIGGRNVVAILGAGPIGNGREDGTGGGGGAECECEDVEGWEGGCAEGECGCAVGTWAVRDERQCSSVLGTSTSCILPAVAVPARFLREES